MTGLKTFNSKWPLEPPTVMATWLPKTWAQTIVIASDCVGFTLPGMIEEPGSFSGSESSPRPHLQQREKKEGGDWGGEVESKLWIAPFLSSKKACRERAEMLL